MTVLKPAIYLLCFAASVVCLVLLIRTYLHKRTKLLLWSALSFVFLALNNVMVFLDIVILPEVDLVPVRTLSSLLAVGVLLYGFIWESD